MLRSSWTSNRVSCDHLQPTAVGSSFLRKTVSLLWWRKRGQDQIKRPKTLAKRRFIRSIREKAVLRSRVRVIQVWPKPTLGSSWLTQSCRDASWSSLEPRHLKTFLAKIILESREHQKSDPNGDTNDYGALLAASDLRLQRQFGLTLFALPNSNSRDLNSTVLVKPGWFCATLDLSSSFCAIISRAIKVFIGRRQGESFSI